MNIRRRWYRENRFAGSFALSAVLAVLAALSLAVYGENTDTEINALITRVETSDCIFVRNGDAHTAADAADHLRLKYRRGKRYADSAEDFIDRLASESSWTGKPYFINCPDTGERTAKAWLTDELDRLRRELY